MKSNKLKGDKNMLRDVTERNIKDIIIETYEEEAKFQDEDFDDFYIFVSTITAYGYSKDENRGSCRKHK